MLAGCESYLSPFCAVDQVLENFHDRFIKEVDASTIVFQLQRQNVIPDNVLTAVNMETSATRQNYILYAHLERTSTKESLLTVCEVIIAVPGNPRMRALGEDMKRKLEGKYCVFIRTCMHFCMCTCVTWSAWMTQATPSLSAPQLQTRPPTVSSKG